MAGYECKFVEQPPQSFQTDCPICLLVLRDPYQVTCCGKSFCKECIEPIRQNHQDCPTCNSQRFEIYRNLGLQQPLCDFRVYCTHKSKGCEWTGELRELDNHLGSDPPADKSLQGCLYTPIKCPVSFTKCDIKLPRKEMVTHLSEGAISHTLLLSSKIHELSLENQGLRSSVRSLQSKNQRLEADVSSLLVDNSRLQERMTSLEEKVKVVTGTVYKFTMSNFYKYRHKHKEWSSQPFYSHPQGYKMCLICNASSKGDDAYLSVYVCLMAGEYDEFLEWPLRGELTIHLLDQTGLERHCSHTVLFDDRGSKTALNQVRYGLRAETAVGFPKFIRLYDLHPRYLKDDRLLFKITDINCMQ